MPPKKKSMSFEEWVKAGKPSSFEDPKKEVAKKPTEAKKPRAKKEKLPDFVKIVKGLWVHKQTGKILNPKWGGAQGGLEHTKADERVSNNEVKSYIRGDDFPVTQTKSIKPSPLHIAHKEHRTAGGKTAMEMKKELLKKGSWQSRNLVMQGANQARTYPPNSWYKYKFEEMERREEERRELDLWWDEREKLYKKYGSSLRPPEPKKKIKLKKKEPKKEEPKKEEPKKEEPKKKKKLHYKKKV